MNKNNKYVLLNQIVDLIPLEKKFYDANLHAEIKIQKSTIRRIGVEFLGLEAKSEKIDQIVLLDSNENKSLDQLHNKFINNKEITITKMLENLVTLCPPCIIFCKKFLYGDELIKIAKTKNIPIFFLNSKKYVVPNILVPFLNQKIRETMEVHGTCLNIFNQGVIIRGRSGIGKSELALSLIHRNHFFVADDRVIIYYGNLGLSARAPESIKNLLEIRGIGIINVGKMFGDVNTVNATPLNIIIDLVEDTKLSELERVNYNYSKITIMEDEVAHYQIPVTKGRLLWALVEAAVLHKKQQDDGKTIINELNQNITKLMNGQIPD